MVLLVGGQNENVVVTTIVILVRGQSDHYKLSTKLSRGLCCGYRHSNFSTWLG